MANSEKKKMRFTSKSRLGRREHFKSMAIINKLTMLISPGLKLQGISRPY